MIFTKEMCRRWMKNAVALHTDKNGEVNTTSLAESCAHAFNQNDEGGPLDDETHWIWDIAMEFDDGR